MEPVESVPEGQGDRQELEDLTDDRFRNSFDRVRGWIVAEWPSLDPQVIAATEGQLERAIDAIAGQTDRTRTWVRRQLGELVDLAERERSARGKRNQDELDRNDRRGQRSLADLEEIFDLLEERAETLAAQFKQDLLPEVQKQTRRHPATSLLLAVGVGFFLGLTLGGMRRGR